MPPVTHPPPRVTSRDDGLAALSTSDSRSQCRGSPSKEDLEGGAALFRVLSVPLIGGRFASIGTTK